MNVAILTSGGDSQGMNACIEDTISLLRKSGHVPFVVYCGYEGLITGNIKKPLPGLYKNISHLGGSVIKSYRSKEFMTEKGFNSALENLKTYGIDVLIIIGGDGSFKGAEKLILSGVNVLAIPATIDNDLFYTDQSLGFDTAVNNAVDAIDKIKQTMSSLSRICINEVMGRNCSAIAVHCAVATNADAAILSSDYSYEKILGKLQKAIKDGVDSPSVIVRENILDISALKSRLQNDLDREVRCSAVGYVQRGGAPTVSDRILAKRMAKYAVHLIGEKKFGFAIGIKNKIMFKVPVSDALFVTSRREEDLEFYI